MFCRFQGYDYSQIPMAPQSMNEGGMLYYTVGMGESWDVGIVPAVWANV